MRHTLQVLSNKGLTPLPLDTLLPMYCLPVGAYEMLKARQS